MCKPSNESNYDQPTFDYSIVIPVYLNEENITDLIKALESLINKITGRVEVVFVVDGSPDHSYTLLYRNLPGCSFSTQLITLSRNFGSFAAIRQGLEMARGNHIAVMAADLQEPPSLIHSFFKRLKSKECDIVFGMRTNREDGVFSRLCSNIFWTLYRKFVMADIPKGGVDIFACNQIVRKSILQISEPNSSLIAQLFWVGFRREFMPYKRQKREKGVSAWKFASKLRYMFDSIFSFSDLPVLMLLWIGGIGVLLSILIGFATLIAKLTGYIDVPGYTTLILLQLFFASLFLLSQGIIGSYLWRTFENTKKRPLSIRCMHEYFTPKE